MQLMSGAVWCQVLDAFFAGVVAMSKVRAFTAGQQGTLDANR